MKKKNYYLSPRCEALWAEPMEIIAQSVDVDADSVVQPFIPPFGPEEQW
jgi:hypothetical protein